MVRRHLDPVQVRTGATGTPESFRWRGRRHVVHEVHDHWYERRAWWLDAGTGTAGASGDGAPVTEAEVWRVLTGPPGGASGGVVEIRRAGPGADAGAWVLTRVLD